MQITRQEGSNKGHPAAPTSSRTKAKATQKRTLTGQTPRGSQRVLEGNPIGTPRRHPNSEGIEGTQAQNLSTQKEPMQPRKGTPQSQLRRQLDSTQRAPRFSPEGTQSQPRKGTQIQPSKGIQKRHPVRTPRYPTH